MNRIMISPLKNQFAPVLFCVFSLTLSNVVHAGMIDYQQHPFSIDSQQIVRDGQTLSLSSPSTIADFVQGMDYIYSQDTFMEVAIAHTGSALADPAESTEPQIYQHVYAYTIPEGISVAYHAENTTGHLTTYQYDTAQIQTMSGSSTKIPKYFKIAGNLDLNGSLLLAKSDMQGEDGYKGLLASFNVVINKLIPDGDGGYKTKKVLKGTVELIGKKNGDVKIRTKGAIRKKDISLITETEDFFKIEFTDEAIPYKVKTRLGEEYILDTTIYSFVNINGAGTGAEVMFLPGSPLVPSFQTNGFLPAEEEPNNNEVPEPATMLFLLSGMAYLRKCTKAAVSVDR